MHLSAQNKPAFISESFIPFYLNVKIFEFPGGTLERDKVAVHMKNDPFPRKDSITAITTSKINQFTNAIFTIPITNINENYVIEKLSIENSYISKYEFPTENLQEGLIYRNNFNGLRFWTQILRGNEKSPFSLITQAFSGLLSVIFFSFTSFAFSLRILSSRTDAGSSLGFWGTRRPSMASCRIEFFNCCAFIAPRF